MGKYMAYPPVHVPDLLTCSGGKSESILDYRIGPARFQQAQNQEVTDKSVRALLKSYMDKRPLVLLVDDKYALFPFDLSASGYTYIVLGFYWISHAWGMSHRICIHDMSVTEFVLQPSINLHPMVGGLSAGSSPFGGAGKVTHGGQCPRNRVSFPMKLEVISLFLKFQWFSFFDQSASPRTMSVSTRS